jgi:hypothetical protein
MDRFLEICTGLIAQPGLAHVVGLCGLTWALPLTGRAQEATAVAEETVTAARDHGSPYWIGMALYGYGQAVSETDPPRALVAWREGLGYTRERGLRNWEALIAKDAARLEAVYGELEEGLSLFQTTIDSFHRAGDHVNEAATLLKLASALNHLERPESRPPSTALPPDWRPSLAASPTAFAPYSARAPTNVSRPWERRCNPQKPCSTPERRSHSAVESLPRKALPWAALANTRAGRRATRWEAAF